MEAMVTAHEGASTPVDAAPAVVDFAAFYQVNHPVIARALALTIGDAGLAAEATDEAMTRACQRWTRVQHYDNPSGWVYRVGLNWARSWFRRHREVPSLWTDQPSPPVAPVDPALDAAIGELDVKHRSVVVLRYLLDWSVAETAAALDIAPGTVKSRLSRALDQLEVRLHHLNPEPSPEPTTPDSEAASP